MVRRLSWTFGALAGVMVTIGYAAGSLFGTPLFAHLRELYPYFFGLPWGHWFFVWGIPIVLALAGAATACLTRRFAAAVQVGALSGLIGSSILFVTGMGITVAFHDSIMKDPVEVHEYELSMPTPHTPAELSSFVYVDALGGVLMMIWIIPLEGMILGSIGGGGGMLFLLACQKRSRAEGSDLSTKMRSGVTPLPLHDSL
jgi:hypothetical protein